MTEGHFTSALTRICGPVFDPLFEQMAQWFFAQSGGGQTVSAVAAAALQAPPSLHRFAPDNMSSLGNSIGKIRSGVCQREYCQGPEVALCLIFDLTF